MSLSSRNSGFLPSSVGLVSASSERKVKRLRSRINRVFGRGNVAKIRSFVPGFDPTGISLNIRAIGCLAPSGANAPIDFIKVSKVWRSGI
jgi:hypothetical protein